MVAGQWLDPGGDVDGAERADAVAAAPGSERHEEEEDGRQQGQQLEPVVEGLYERDAAHATGQHGQAHDDGDGDLADP